MNVKQLEETYRKYAESQGWKLNPDKKLVRMLLKGQLENEKKYGYRFCTCKVRTGNFEEDKKIICPCTSSKLEVEKWGHCWCRLFIKKR